VKIEHEVKNGMDDIKMSDMTDQEIAELSTFIIKWRDRALHPPTENKFEEAEKIIRELCKVVKLEGNLKIVECQSPKHLATIHSKDSENPSKVQGTTLFNLMTDCVTLAVKEFVQSKGVELKSPVFDLFGKLADCVCAAYLTDDNTFYLMAFPTVLRFDDRIRFHSETGPAFLFPDGYGEYYHHGFKIDKRLVTEPESITLEEIRSETNAELKRIKIDRYGGGTNKGGGVAKYLRDSKAKVIDVDTHTHNGTRAVISIGEGRDEQRYLNVADPSSARIYYMEIPPATMTCQEADVWLAGDMQVAQVGRT
jgi:hypothetical protein